jgi:hypothetical protein
VDTDRDGRITRGEIQEATAVDYNGDGTIDDAEKVRAGKEWLDANFAQQDADGDQAVTLAELLAWNTNQP